MKEEIVIAIFRVKTTTDSNATTKELLKLNGAIEVAQGKTAEAWLERINAK